MRASKILTSTWMAWFLVTLLYVTLLLANARMHSQVVNGLNMTAGLFVPIGIFNFFASVEGGPDVQLQNGWMITFPLIVCVLSLADFSAFKFRIGVAGRLLYNAAVLLVLTAAVDLILWHAWRSLALVQNLW